MKKFKIFISAITIVFLTMSLCACNGNQNSSKQAETTVKTVDEGQYLEIELDKFNKLGAVSTDLSKGETEYKTNDTEIIAKFKNQISNAKSIKVNEDERNAGGIHFILYNNDEILYHIYYVKDIFTVNGISGDFKSDNFDEKTVSEIYNGLVNR